MIYMTVEAGSVQAVISRHDEGAHKRSEVVIEAGKRHDYLTTGANAFFVRFDDPVDLDFTDGTNGWRPSKVKTWAFGSDSGISVTATNESDKDIRGEVFLSRDDDLELPISFPPGYLSFDLTTILASNITTIVGEAGDVTLQITTEDPLLSARLDGDNLVLEHPDGFVDGQTLTLSSEGFLVINTGD